MSRKKEKYNSKYLIQNVNKAKQIYQNILTFFKIVLKEFKMNNTEKEILFNCIDEHHDDILQDFKKFVQIPSLTGEEYRDHKFIFDKFNGMVLKVEIWEPNIKELFDKFPQIAQYPSKWQPEFGLPLKFEDICTYEQLVSSPYADELNYTDRLNAVGSLKGYGKKRSLILNGHIDVITTGDEKNGMHRSSVPSKKTVSYEEEMPAI